MVLDNETMQMIQNTPVRRPLFLSAKNLFKKLSFYSLSPCCSSGAKFQILAHGPNLINQRTPTPSQSGSFKNGPVAKVSQTIIIDLLGWGILYLLEYHLGEQHKPRTTGDIFQPQEESAGESSGYQGQNEPRDREKNT